ncbi:hypothetical protein D3C87_1241200 [compost metagenome]
MVVLVNFLDQVHQHFRIGVTLKFMSAAQQLFLKRRIVLNNPVMDNGQLAIV